jgi:hypothetical protein
MIEKRLLRLRERLTDPLLTVLTVMLAIFMFVIAPMQAAGFYAVHLFAIAFALVLVAAIFIISGSWAAVGCTLIAVTLVIAATVHRIWHPSSIDIYLDAGAWMITGVTLGVVVGRAVFAPGRVTFHRILGAVLLYLNIALVFVALYCCRSSRTRRVHRHSAAARRFRSC